MIPQREPRRSNGHAGSHGRPNGHGAISTSPSFKARAERLEPDGAASDDTRDFPSAAAAHAAAGTGRDEYAEAASSAEGEKNKRPRPASACPPATPRSNQDPETASDTVDIPPGEEPLPSDGSGFVDAMHEHVDLYLACARFVKSKDEKIAQRMVERLLEMKFGKEPSASTEETPRIVLDIDSAVARSAAEGANK